MNLIDSSGWLEYFSGSTRGEIYSDAIQDIDNLLVPAICIYEVFKRILVQGSEENALEAVGWMSVGNVVELDQELAIMAAHYSEESRIPMADSMILATARKFDAIIWTQDEHFSGLPGVKYYSKT